MPRAPHTFHTRHDFTPDLGFSAFRLLAQPRGTGGLSLDEIHNTARETCAALARRTSAQKVLASLVDLGVAELRSGLYRLAAPGQHLLAGIGRLETGFRASIHCLYTWRWLWQNEPTRATPTWSYRRVCARLLGAPVTGVTADELVLQVVADASRFGCESVSFSRSSVAGVTAWLSAQSPSLIQQLRGGRMIPAASPPSPTALRLHLAALCSLGGGRVRLDQENLAHLAEALLLPPGQFSRPLQQWLEESREFMFVAGSPPQIMFRGANDPFVEWLACKVKSVSPVQKTGLGEEGT